MLSFLKTPTFVVGASSPAPTGHRLLAESKIGFYWILNPLRESGRKVEK
jgi:hypothetical protein